MIYIFDHFFNVEEGHAQAIAAVDSSGNLGACGLTPAASAEFGNAEEARAMLVGAIDELES